MAEYYYDVDSEVFKRTDKRGNHLAINIAEAQRIISLLDLGYTAYKIENKINLSNPKAGISTIRSFIKNYQEGNIIMPENAPAPVHMFQALTDSDRLENLEKRVSILEDIVNGKNESKWNKVKSWIS